MSLSGKQKKYLLKHIRNKNISEMAESLNTSEKDIKAYLKNRWSKEKFNQFFSEQKQDLIPSFFNLKNWIVQNKTVLLLLIGLTLITYANSFNNSFVSDDVATIEKSANLHLFNYVTSQIPSFLRPFFYFIINQLFGRNPFFFRSLSIFFHIGTSWSVYLLLSLLLNSRIAFIASVLFTVHPLQSEAIDWISGGTYSQQSFFLMISITAFVLSLKNMRYYLISLLFFLLALFSLERAMVLPGILFVLLISEKNFTKHWKKLIIPGIISAFWAYLFIVKIPARLTSLETEYYQKPESLNPLVQIPIAISSYIQLTLWPKALTLYHSEMFFSKINFAIRAMVTTAFFLSIVISFFKNKKVFFWLSFFVIALLPTLTPFGISWIVAERYVYMGAIGLYTIIAIGLHKLWQQDSLKKPVTGIIIVLIFCLSVRTIVRNNDWQNQDTLWSSAAKTSPSSPQNHNNLGDLYARKGEFEKSAEEFKIAIQLNPSYADAMHNLANVYWQSGNLEQAQDYYLQAISINPRLWQSYQNLAYIHNQKQEHKKAKEYLEKAIEINPQNGELYKNLAIIYKYLGDQTKSEELLKQSILLSPDTPETGN